MAVPRPTAAPSPMWIVRQYGPGVWIYGPISAGMLADPILRRRWLYAATQQQAVFDADRRARIR